MEISRYFAYGSNMNPARMLARGLLHKHCEAAELRGFELVFNKQSHLRDGVAYANIAVSTSAAVEGVLYVLKDAQQLALMDQYEGTPVRYSRDVFHITTASGCYSAWVYTANPAYVKTGLLPESNYLEHLLSAEQYLSESYFSKLKQQPCLASRNDSCSEKGLLYNV